MFLPPVLVPGLDLCVGEIEGGCQLHAILNAQVLLPLEAALQLGQLVVREGRPGLSGFLQPNLRAVSTAGDLPVPFFLHWRTETEKTKKTEEMVKTEPRPPAVRAPSIFVWTASVDTTLDKSEQHHYVKQIHQTKIKKIYTLKLFFMELWLLPGVTLIY